MCPVCLAAAALIAGKVTSTGGAAAIVIRKFGGKKAVDNNPAPNLSKLSGNENAAGEIVPISNQRRDPYANDRDSEREDRVA
jgi:hypothetical protein